jgi:hypothetical protein
MQCALGFAPFSLESALPMNLRLISQFSCRAVLALTVACAFALPTTSHAEPYLASQNGLKCSQCHVNRTGGGKRNAFGFTYTQFMLARKAALSNPPFDPALSPHISTGANLRLESFTSFGHGNDSARAEASSQMRVPEGNVYVEIDMVRNFLKLYADQAIAPSPESREAFALIELPKAAAYVKVGKMLQPFGLRLYDDDTPTRNITQFTYANPKVGLEVGAEPGPLSLAWSVAETQSSASATMHFSGLAFPNSFRIGASAYRTYGEVSKAFTPLRRYDQGAGVYAGMTYRALTLLGEIDWARKQEGGLAIDKTFGFAEVDWLVSKGINLKTAFDFTHPDTRFDFARNGRSRLVAGVEYFPVSHLQFAAFYHLRTSIPQDLARNQDQMRIQAHAFY